MAAGDASGQYEPSGQLVQDSAVEPTSPRNVPAAQRVGVAVPLMGHLDPAGHGMQSDFDIDPYFSLYVPSGHFVAFSDPLLANVPGKVRIQSI